MCPLFCIAVFVAAKNTCTYQHIFLIDVLLMMQNMQAKIVDFDIYWSSDSS